MHRESNPIDADHGQGEVTRGSLLVRQCLFQICLARGAKIGMFDTPIAHMNKTICFVSWCTTIYKTGIIPGMGEVNDHMYLPFKVRG